MNNTNTSYVINASEILSYAAGTECTDVALKFLADYYIGKNDRAFSETLTQKGFAMIKEEQIFLDPVIKYIFDKICSAEKVIVVKNITLLFSENIILGIKKEKAVIERFSLTPLNNREELEKFVGEAWSLNKIEENGVRTDKTLKEYLEM